MIKDFSIVGHLVGEPIENLETGEVELKISINTKEGYGNVVVTTKNEEVINYAKRGHKDNLVAVTVYLADKNRLVVERITFLSNKENNDGR